MTDKNAELQKAFNELLKAYTNYDNKKQDYFKLEKKIQLEEGN